MKWLFGILLIIAIIIFVPMLTIWCFNTLFPVLEIPYTISTWFASLLLFSGTTSKFWKGN